MAPATVIGHQLGDRDGCVIGDISGQMPPCPPFEVQPTGGRCHVPNGDTAKQRYRIDCFSMHCTGEPAIRNLQFVAILVLKQRLQQHYL